MSEEYEDQGVFEKAKAEAREYYATQPLLELIKSMKTMGELKAAEEEKLKVINARYDVLRLEMIPERMDAEGIENMKVDGVGRVSLTGDMFVSVKTGGKDGLFSWFKKHKLGDLIQPTVNSSTLKAFVKRRIKEGKDYPTDFLNVTPVTRASITKS